MSTFKLSGNIVDVVQRKVFPGTVTVENGLISAIDPTSQPVPDRYIMPGFIDAHVHVESSMLIPSEFARLAVTHGTVATISDPHEIGNVLGIEGVRYMIDNGKQVPFKFYFGAPSCVPATSFETAGAHITAEEIRTLFVQDKLVYLSEMMNYPGVLARDPLVMQKIQVAKELGLPVDGHAPGLKGKEAERYCAAGITTDHECYTLDEALEKITYGMLISIREGSAAKNYDALHPLLAMHPKKVMFCSDDKHPNELVEGHINQLVVRSIVKHGYDVLDVLHAACVQPVHHYKLDVGLLQVGQPADFIVVNNLKEFAVQQTYINGVLVADKGKSLIKSVASSIVNNFHISPKKEEDFLVTLKTAVGDAEAMQDFESESLTIGGEHSQTVKAPPIVSDYGSKDCVDSVSPTAVFRVIAKGERIQVIKALDGQLITEKVVATAKIVDNHFVSDPERDILKIAVVNRYKNAPVAVAFIQGFGLKRGALASCIAHDSHNIIAVGVSDHDICQAVNAVIKSKGGISVASWGSVDVLPLPVAGIMSHNDGYSVAQSYSKIDQEAKALGTSLHAPFMTLSFMVLLVIPSLKLSDKGLFDATSFTFTPLYL